MTRLTDRFRNLSGRSRRATRTVEQPWQLEPGDDAMELRVRAGLADLDDALFRALNGPLRDVAHALDIRHGDQALAVFRTRVDDANHIHFAGMTLVTADGREWRTCKATDRSAAFLHNALCAFVYRTCEQHAFALVVCPGSDVVIGWRSALCIEHDSHEPVVWFHLADGRVDRGRGDLLAEGRAPDAVLDVYARVTSRMDLLPYELAVC
jgi:hypothetical protein